MSFYDDASIVLIPSGYKTSKLYSQKPTDGSGDLTFTRTGSTATRVNESGLIERCRTNLLLQSQTFDNAIWNKVRSSVSANSISAPNNTLTGYTLIDNTENNIHYISQTISAITGVYTVSVYAKAKELSQIQIAALGGTTAMGRGFDLSNGTTFIESLGGVSSNDLGQSITSVGNGWYKCTMSWTATGQTSIWITTSFNNNATYLGNGTDGVYIWGAQLELGDIATDYIPTTSAAVTVGPIANLPRLDYTGGGCPKLLMEPTRTNNILYSEMFSDTSWTKTNAIVSGNVEVSPDGYRNADLLLADTTNALHNVNIANLVSVSGTTYVASVFVKYGGYDYVNIQTSNATTANLTFRFSTEQATLAGTRAVVGSEKVEKFPNGWFRLSYATVSIVTATFVHTINIRNDLNQSTFIGDGTKGVYAYGFQYEIGSYATSYIPTFNASVTRNADSASKTGISSLIGQTEGTIVLEYDKIEQNMEAGIFFQLGLSSEKIYISKESATQNIFQLATQNGGAYNFINTSNITTNKVKIAIAYKQGDNAFYVNGSLISSSSAATNPTTLNNLYFFNPAGSNPFLKLNQALLFKTRLSNSDLATLTTL